MVVYVNYIVKAGNDTFGIAKLKNFLPSKKISNKGSRPFEVFFGN